MVLNDRLDGPGAEHDSLDLQVVGRRGLLMREALAVDVDIPGVGSDEPGEVDRVVDVGVAVVGDALVQKPVILRHPEDGLLEAPGTGPTVAPNIAVAFVAVHTPDTAQRNDAVSSLLKELEQSEVSRWNTQY